MNFLEFVIAIDKRKFDLTIYEIMVSCDYDWSASYVKSNTVEPL